ncbi:MAG: hypothetical protein FWG90_02645 [Oscillospiraceae bacterium]|nr:hypothetical protein [Oscillospiraceae bacterium]
MGEKELAFLEKDISSFLTSLNSVTDRLGEVAEAFSIVADKGQKSAEILQQFSKDMRIATENGVKFDSVIGLTADTLTTFMLASSAIIKVKEQWIFITELLGKALSAIPYAAMIAGATVVGLAIKEGIIEPMNRDLAKATERANKNILAFNESMKEVVSNFRDTSALKEQAARYEELRKRIGVLTNEEMTELNRLARELSEILPAGTSLIDEQTGAFKELSGGVDQAIDRIEALQMVELFTAQHSLASENIAEISAKLEEQEQIVRNANKFGILQDGYQQAKLAAEEAKKEIQNLNQDLYENELALKTAEGQLPQWTGKLDAANESIRELYPEINNIAGAWDNVAIAADGTLIATNTAGTEMLKGIKQNAEEAERVEAQYLKRLQELTDEQERISQLRMDAEEAVKLAIIESANAQGLTYEELKEKLKKTADAIYKTFETMSGGLGDLTKKITLDSDTMWETIRDNQEENIKNTEEFSELYAELIKAGVSDSYLNAIGANKVEAIPLLRDMMDEGIDAVLASEKQWHEAYGIITETLCDSLEVDEEQREAIKQYISNENSGIYGNLKSVIENANFNLLGLGIGEDINQGIAEGIAEYSHMPLSAIGELFKAMSSGQEYLSKALPYVNGSHRAGLDYVPYDNYMALLHKGERVVTAQENQSSNWGQGRSANFTMNVYGNTADRYEILRDTEDLLRMGGFC